MPCSIDILIITNQAGDRERWTGRLKVDPGSAKEASVVGLLLAHVGSGPCISIVVRCDGVGAAEQSHARGLLPPRADETAPHGQWNGSSGARRSDSRRKDDQEPGLRDRLRAHLDDASHDALLRRTQLAYYVPVTPGPGRCFLS